MRMFLLYRLQKSAKNCSWSGERTIHFSGVRRETRSPRQESGRAEFAQHRRSQTTPQVRDDKSRLRKARQRSSVEAPGLAGPAGLFLPRSSQKAFKKNTAERLSMMRISNSPSTVVIVPLTTIHAIPASGIKPSTMEIKSITATKSPPYEMQSMARLSFAKKKDIARLAHARG